MPFLGKKLNFNYIAFMPVLDTNTDIEHYLKRWWLNLTRGVVVNMYDIYDKTILNILRFHYKKCLIIVAYSLELKMTKTQN